jgi:hypothetical protein
MQKMKSAFGWLSAPAGRPLDRTWRIRRLVQTGFLLTCVFIGFQFYQFIPDHVHRVA